VGCWSRPPTQRGRLPPHVGSQPGSTAGPGALGTKAEHKTAWLNLRKKRERRESLLFLCLPEELYSSD
jgi:hypothetical protein